MSKKLQEITEEELKKVNGGVEIIEIGCSGMTHPAAVIEYIPPVNNTFFNQNPVEP